MIEYPKPGAIERHLNLKTRVGEWEVSTVDLMGIDHSFGMGHPLLYETMVFLPDSEDPYSDHDCRRYSTQEEAEKGHEQTVAEYRAKEAGSDGQA